MTFQLESMTKVRVLDVRTTSSKDRKPGDPVGSQLLLRATLSSQALGMFDSALPGLLYRMSTGKKQGELDGIESAELTQIGDHVKRLPWVYEQTGCVVLIDFGTGGPRDIHLADCKAHAVSITPRQGGSVDVQWTVDAPALSTDTRGKLTDLKSTDVQLTMFGPTVQDDAQRDIEDDDEREPAPARKPGAAEKAAVANVKGVAKYLDKATGSTWSGRGLQPAWLKAALKKGAKISDFEVKIAHKLSGPEARAAAEAAFKPTLSTEAAWPFPKDPPKEAPPQSVTTTRHPAQSRTARGRDATKAALARGAKS